MSSKWVYRFNEGDKSMKNLLGGKGANLAEMTSIGLPVPPGFTITTEVCNHFSAHGDYPEGVDEQVAAALAALEADTGKKFGDAADPLLISVRSGARASMPGMMDTILNLGLNDTTVQGVIATTGNPRFAYDCYRRFVSMYGDVVLGCKPEHEDERDPFEEILEAAKGAKGIQYDTELDEGDLKDLVVKFKAAVKQRTANDFPDDPLQQLWGANTAVFGSWNNDRAVAYRRLYDIPDTWGTAVNVQTMVYGNTGEESGTGVAFTRDPATGEDVFYGEFLVNAQGEDADLAVGDVSAGGGVAGEGDAGAGLLAGVAVHHGLHVDGGAPRVGDVVEAAVGDGAVVVPAAEHRGDGAPELLQRVVGEVVAGALLDGGLELDHQVLEVALVELGVVLDPLGLLGRLEDLLEGVALVLVLGLAAQHHVTVHRDEPAVAVVGEARVAGRRDDALHGGVVEAQVEDGVHHAGHGGAGAGAHRDQQRIGGVAELLAGVGLERGERGGHLLVDALGVIAVGREVVADLGGDREAGRHRQPDAGHLGEVGALAAEQVLHALVALVEPVDPLARHQSLLGIGTFFTPAPEAGVKKVPIPRSD